MKKGLVTLLEYDWKWKEEFEKEKIRLLKILPKNSYICEHIGSTSIPGMPAKPIIDFMIGVIHIEEAESLKTILEHNLYEFRPNGTTLSRLLFVKGEEECRTHHLSLVVKDSFEWGKLLKFRNHLIKNPEIAKDYSDLKRKLCILSDIEFFQRKNSTKALRLLNCSAIFTEYIFNSPVKSGDFTQIYPQRINLQVLRT